MTTIKKISIFLGAALLLWTHPTEALGRAPSRAGAEGEDGEKCRDKVTVKQMDKAVDYCQELAQNTAYAHNVDAFPSCMGGFFKGLESIVGSE